MSDITNEAVCYLTENAVEPFQRYILRKEILGIPCDDSVMDSIHKSKWYINLSEEQLDDGSYGRFHSMDSKAAKGRTFLTTESALRRMLDLGLTADDDIVAGAVRLMERYLGGEDEWRDNVEKHKDNGKSFIRARDFITAANLILFDPKNPAAAPFRDICANQLRAAFSSGVYDDFAWEKFNRDYTGTCLSAFMLYSLRLTSGGALDRDTERLYLDFIWNREEGIYYVSNDAASEIVYLEDKKFSAWLYALEVLGGFPLFGEYMNNGAYEHLQTEIKRLLKDDVKLPPEQPVIGRYAESRRDKRSRKNDLMLRILRILKKCRSCQ